MRAIILSIGDELVLGQTVDTNSAWLSQQLAAVGCAVAAHLTVPDDQRAIEQAMEESVGRCDVLIISGGIGPTDDDLTRQALAAVLRVPLELNEAWLAELEKFFQQRGRPMPPLNRIQAMIPRGAAMIFNTCGTAAGIDAAYVSGDQKTVCRVFVVPGVPKEMKAMFTRDILPHVKQQSGGAVILSRTLHTFGLGESTVAEKLGDLMRRDRNPSVGTTVTGGVVSLRLNARFQSDKIAETEMARTVFACRESLGDLIYGEDDETLAVAVSKLLVANDSATHNPRPITVATAESCTGGLVAKMLTDVPGSSRYFNQGWVTYTNESKTDLLGVPPGLIDQFGAVSEAVVKVMANSARARAKSDLALAVSGVAGPGGGTEAKPVGTVCLALADTKGVVTRTFHFPGDREWVRDRSAKMALAMLRYHLLGRRMPF
jgi:nicotinamide-nucleotide amidase